MRVRARKFPGIINSTTIDWYHAWPKNALINVADKFIDNLEFPSEMIKKNVSEYMAEVHTSIDLANE